MEHIVNLILFIVGIVFFIVVFIPVFSAIVTMMVMAFLMGAALVGSMALYVIGIPIAIGYRIKYGYWA